MRYPEVGEEMSLKVGKISNSGNRIAAESPRVHIIGDCKPGDFVDVEVVKHCGGHVQAEVQKNHGSSETVSKAVGGPADDDIRGDKNDLLGGHQ